MPQLTSFGVFVQSEGWAVCAVVDLIATLLTTANVTIVRK